MRPRSTKRAALPAAATAVALAVLLAARLCAAGAPPSGECSCASPTPLPLAPGQAWRGTAATAALATSLASGGADAAAALTNGSVPTCSSLPPARAGQPCGTEIAVCKPGLCCGQDGFCSSSPVSCDSGCQCAYSGLGAGCKGAYPFAAPLPSQLPVAARGQACGPYIAVCGSGDCCTQFGGCANDASPYCSKRSCQQNYSPWSVACRHDGGAPKPAVRRFTLRATWARRAPDGYEREVIVLNDELLPTLTATIGDRLVVTFHNALDEPASLHWHGLLQQQTNGMDGAVGVTQRAVPPGGKYIYNFVARTAGTYWFHSHSRIQYLDGLAGSLVVRDPAERPAAEAVVMVRDWYHDKSSLLAARFLRKRGTRTQGNEPTPYTGLINGLGQGYCEKQGGGGCPYAVVQGGPPAACGGPEASMTRLRIVNGGGFAVFNVSVDRHRMIVISQDAVRMQPVEVGAITINNGQRYDVLLCQDTSAAGGAPLSAQPVWIRATMIDEDFVTPSAVNAARAALHFAGGPQPPALPNTTADARPPFLSPETAPLGDGGGEGGGAPAGTYIGPYELSVWGDVAPPPSTRTLTFAIDMHTDPAGQGRGIEYAHFNNVSLSMPSGGPSLLERMGANPEGLAPPRGAAPGGRGWHVVDLALGEVVDVVINNHDDGEHPIHLHGHWAFIMAVGAEEAGEFDPATTPLRPSVARDTITVASESFIVLRFIAHNPGVWLMHCHIEYHVFSGLALIFREGFPNVAAGA